MRHLVLMVGAALVLSGPARAGTPVIPKVPVTSRYKAPATKTFVLTKTATVPATIKPAPKTASPVHFTTHAPQVPTYSIPVQRVTRIKVRTRGHLLPGASSIFVLKEALFSGTSLGEATVQRRPVRTEHRVQVRVNTRSRRVARPTPPSLLRTLQYQFDLVQMSEALGQ